VRYAGTTAARSPACSYFKSDFLFWNRPSVDRVAMSIRRCSERWEAEALALFAPCFPSAFFFFDLLGARCGMFNRHTLAIPAREECFLCSDLVNPPDPV